MKTPPTGIDSELVSWGRMTHLGRMLTSAESLRLMGFDPAKVRVPSITPTQMRSLCGNAMHCGVLARVLAHMLITHDAPTLTYRSGDDATFSPTLKK